jgi:protoporphyrinogen/coproporphyrinogen III oxidase
MSNPSWSNPPRRCLVVGGGLAGLTAAYIVGENPAYDVVVLEEAPQVGGKLRLAEVASVTVDVGAETMLNRRPEGVALAHDLGLAVVHPTDAKPRVWSRGSLRPLPRSVMGVPQDLTELAASQILSPMGFARVRSEADLPAIESDLDDISVGDLVARRMGDEVVDRLVEPLLGGVYAGRAREISARAAVPQLLEQARRGSWLAHAEGVLDARTPLSSSAPHGPVFAGVTGGMGNVPLALVASGRFSVRTDAGVRGVSRQSDGFLVEVATATGTEWLSADDLIIATPAASSAKLLVDVVPSAAAELAQIESASVAVVTLAVPTDVVAESTSGAEMSGFLVPPIERLGLKAATFSWAKWDWVRAAGSAGGLALLRASWGRHREESTLQHTDQELIELTRRDLATVRGLTGPVVDAHVQRWGGGFPQYAVGHVDRVTRIKMATAAACQLPHQSGGRIAVCGAAYDGVGIPAVIASARRAAADIMTPNITTLPAQ